MKNLALVCGLGGLLLSGMSLVEWLVLREVSALGICFGIAFFVVAIINLIISLVVKEN